MIYIFVCINCLRCKFSYIIVYPSCSGLRSAAVSWLLDLCYCYNSTTNTQISLLLYSTSINYCIFLNNIIVVYHQKRKIYILSYRHILLITSNNFNLHLRLVCQPKSLNSLKSGSEIGFRGFICLY